jgi:pimeloyl-ACP methyl ester carboxylesterase
VAVEEHNVEIDGLPIRYLAAGEGPPLILLHGVGDNALDWRWVMPALARDHRIYAPDLPGSGRLAVAWGKRRPGAAQRALARATLLGCGAQLGYSGNAHKYQCLFTV